MDSLSTIMASMAGTLRVSMLESLADLFPVAMLPVAIAGVLAIFGGVVAAIYRGSR